MKRILLVDDERIYSRLYVKALESNGFVVTYCASPKSARKVAAEKSFDLFVIDLMMPSDGMFAKDITLGDLITGACLAKELADDNQNVPIIVFTAHHDPSLLDEVRGYLRACEKVIVLRKRKLNPDEFAKAVIELFYPERKASHLRKFFDCIILQPNVLGFGVDLQAIRKMFAKPR